MEEKVNFKHGFSGHILKNDSVPSVQKSLISPRPPSLSLVAQQAINNEAEGTHSSHEKSQ